MTEHKGTSDKDLRDMLARANHDKDAVTSIFDLIFVLSECVERLMADRIFQDERDDH